MLDQCTATFCRSRQRRGMLKTLVEDQSVYTKAKVVLIGRRIVFGGLGAHYQCLLSMDDACNSLLALHDHR